MTHPDVTAEAVERREEIAQIIRDAIRAYEDDPVAAPMIARDNAAGSADDRILSLLSMQEEGWRKQPGMNRVDLDSGSLDDHGALDDLAITGDLIDMLRLERMDNHVFWGRIYMRDGRDYVLGFVAAKGKLAAEIHIDGPPPQSAGQDGGEG